MVLRVASQLKSGELFSSPLVLWILLFSLFEPESLGVLLPPVSAIFNLCKMLTCCALIVYAVLRRKVSTLCLALATFQAYLVIVTLFQGGRVVDTIKAMASVVTICLVIDVANEVGAFWSALRVTRDYLLVWAIVSLALALIFPKGMYLAGSPESYANSNALRENAVRFFLGHKNQIVPFLFPGYLSAGAISLHSKNKKDEAKSWVMLVVMCATAIVVDSMTSVLLCIYLGIAYILISHGRLCHLSVIGALSFVGVVDVGISLFRAQELIAPLFRLMGRNATLSNRTTIWDGAIKAIGMSPLFGHGVAQNSITAKDFAGFNTAHNMYLTTAYYGGFFGIVAYVACIYLALRDLSRSGAVESKFILLAICGLLLMGVVESLGIGFTTIVFPLAVAFNCSGQLEKRSNERLL